MYIECKQLVECLVWLIFLELRIYHIAKLKLYKFPKTQCIQCTVLCYVHRLGGMDMTNIEKMVEWLGVIWFQFSAIH